MSPDDAAWLFLGLGAGVIIGRVLGIIFLGAAKTKKSDDWAKYARELEGFLSFEAEMHRLWLKRYEEHRNRVRLG